MSEVSNDVSKQTDEGASMKLENSYYSNRGNNPWPTPTKQAGGAFGNTGGSSEQPKKFGGGFGSGTFDGFGSSGRSAGAELKQIQYFHESSNFSQRKKPVGLFNVSRGGFGVGEGFGSGGFGSGALPSRQVGSELGISKDRCETPPPSESVFSRIPPSRGGYGGSSRSSDVLSPSKRSRTGRRTGRRGRGPGHCFHCQEHGHISRACPKKVAEDTDDFEGEGTEVNQFTDEETVTSGQQGPISLAGRDGSYQNAKLENQKARESYYGGYGYGKNSNSNVMKSSTGIGSGTRSITSPEIDKFSEQLDNALKLSIVETPISSPSVMHLTPRVTPDSRIGFEKTAETESIKPNSLPARDGIKEISSEMLTIETRRVVMREGELHFEETTVISFPRDLPPNVRVITAQFVPVSSSEES